MTLEIYRLLCLLSYSLPPPIKLSLIHILTVERILDVSQRLFLEKGYDNTTIQDTPGPHNVRAEHM